LRQTADGKLYGITRSGNEGGALFSFDPYTNAYNLLYDFGYSSSPSGGLIENNDGKLYGMATQGGVDGKGNIYSFDPTNSNYTKLKDFMRPNGGEASGSLIQGHDGKLYGMTPEGGINGEGVIFSFDTVTNVYTKLHDFIFATGTHPCGSLLQISDGKLYGLTLYGGDLGGGVLFSFDISTNTYTI